MAAATMPAAFSNVSGSRIYLRIYGISVTIEFRPKPDPDSYRVVLARAAASATQGAMFDDSARNLAPAAALGLTTIWLRNNPAWTGIEFASATNQHIHTRRRICARFSRVSEFEMSFDLARIVDEAWERRDSLDSSSGGSVREAVEQALDALDSGRLRVAEKHAGEWHVHQWLKKPCCCRSV